MGMNINERAIHTIREMRIVRGIKQATLSTVIGCSESAWSRIERGERPMNLQELEVIADFLSVQPMELLGIHAVGEEQKTITLEMTIRRIDNSQVIE